MAVISKFHWTLHGCRVVGEGLWTYEGLRITQLPVAKAGANLPIASLGGQHVLFTAIMPSGWVGIMAFCLPSMSGTVD